MRNRVCEAARQKPLRENVGVQIAQDDFKTRKAGLQRFDQFARDERLTRQNG